MATGTPGTDQQSIPKNTLPNWPHVHWLNKSNVQAIRNRNRWYKDSKCANKASHSRMCARVRNRVTMRW